MLFDKLNVKNIEEGIFAVKNFISKDDCKNIVDTLKIEKYSIRKDNIYVYDVNEKTLFYSNFIENIIKENISHPLLIKEGGFNCIVKGNGMSKHNDLDGFDHKRFSKKYGVILYLNDFEGGEINYPKLNKSYHPSAGDLLIHKSYIEHEVLEVKSENRYTYTSYLWSKKDVI